MTYSRRNPTPEEPRLTASGFDRYSHKFVTTTPLRVQRRQLGERLHHRQSWIVLHARSVHCARTGRLSAITALRHPALEMDRFHSDRKRDSYDFCSYVEGQRKGTPTLRNPGCPRGVLANPLVSRIPMKAARHQDDHMHFPDVRRSSARITGHPVVDRSATPNEWMLFHAHRITASSTASGQAN